MLVKTCHSQIACTAPRYSVLSADRGCIHSVIQELQDKGSFRTVVKVNVQVDDTAPGVVSGCTDFNATSVQKW